LKYFNLETHSKENKEKLNKSREEMKEKEKKKLPPEKQTIPPPKGQLPDPTYSRMKLAYRTTGADVESE
jgi:hypothetical protein